MDRKSCEMKFLGMVMHVNIETKIVKCFFLCLKTIKVNKKNLIEMWGKFGPPSQYRDEQKNNEKIKGIRKA